MSGGRIRRIKPELWEDERVHSLTDEQALAWVALFSKIVDDEGRAPWKPVEFSLKVPRFSHQQWTDTLSILTQCGLVVRYEVGGDGYLFVRNWHKHQKVRRPTPSMLPSPQDNGTVELMQKDKDGAVFAPMVTPEDGVPYADIVRLWNDICGKHCPNVNFDPNRDDRLLLVKRAWNDIKERQSLEWWKGYFEKIGASRFLTGRTKGSTFRAPFKWVLLPDKMRNIVEGNYDNPRNDMRSRNLDALEGYLDGDKEGGDKE